MLNILKIQIQIHIIHIIENFKDDFCIFNFTFVSIKNIYSILFYVFFHDNFMKCWFNEVEV